MKIDRPIPTEGQWFTRTNKRTDERAAQHPTDIVRIGKVDTERGEIECQRIDRFTTTGIPIVGRNTRIRFASWQHDFARYALIDDPTPRPVADEPAPESGVKAATAATIEERIAAIDARQRSMDGKLDEALALLRGRANGGGQLPLPAVGR
jgi:hypothetical protein